MITDAEILRIIDYLTKNGHAAAKARATREYLTEYRKSLKSTIMSEHADKPLGVQEREAYRDPRYLQHLDALRIAIQDDELHRWNAAAANTKLEAWRTMSANERIQARV